MEAVLERALKRPYVGRLAPSPTGALHLGNVRTFMIAWLRARSLGGRLIMRMEDLDHPRDKPGAAAAAYEDLKWLGGITILLSIPISRFTLLLSLW